MTLLHALDYLGTVAFAVSGALMAVRKRMDIFGIAVLAAVTAIGGGTVRDALLDVPVFWLQDSAYVLCALGSALVVFLLHKRIVGTALVAPHGGGQRLDALRCFDAVGLGVFTAIGAMKAEAAHTGLVGIVTMACITGVGGGMIRDVLAREIPFVLREQVYASACIVGAFAYWGMLQTTLGQTGAICVAAGLTTALRLAAVVLGWRLPKAS